MKAAQVLWEHHGRRPLSVGQFMEFALYDPVYGYYAQNIRTVGRRGDFATSASLSDLLGKALARWIGTQRGKGHVIEIGPGDGSLAESVLAHLGWWKRRRLVFHLVEVSDSLKRLQQERLAGSRVCWHASVQDALEASGGNALIYSNELLDAFPCEVIARDGNHWREVFLTLENGRWMEMPGAIAASPEVSSRVRRIERHPAWGKWLGQWVRSWKSGAMLTIDYGDREPAVFEAQPCGSMRAFFHHQRFTGEELYARIGHQDLTTDVNFSEWEDACAEYDLETRSFQTQAEFIQASGIFPSDDLGRWLTGDDGAGAAFKVLEQVPTAALSPETG